MTQSLHRALTLSLVSLSLLTASVTQAKVEEKQRFPDINLKSFDGKSKFNMKDLKGKVVLVDFWAKWCEPCQKSLPWMRDMAKKYKGKFVVVGINVDVPEDHAEAKEFLKKEKIQGLTLLADPTSDFIKKVGVTTMPSSFLLDKSGQVVKVNQGYTDEEAKTVEAEIKRLIKAK